MRVLVVDDDRRLLEVMKKGLAEANYAVDTASDGEEGLHYADAGVYDLIILDIMMPKMDGISLLKSIRAKGMDAPILMLTAKDAVEDIVAGLDAGADDYLVKPFAFDELVARTRALVRRKSSEKTPVLSVGDLTMDTVTHEVKRGGKRIELTGKEYIVLEYFMRHPGMVITRTMLEDHAWDEGFDAESNVTDVYIRRLRRKIDREGEESMIHTLRGIGYKLRSA